MTKIQIIVGSTRPGRVSKSVADWVFEHAQAHGGADYELVDIADYNLPVLDEPAPAMMRSYSKEHTQAWSEKIYEADGYIFVTPEYNHGVPGNFKNALDYLWHEFTNKSLGLVSYGVDGGIRAQEQLRQIAGNFELADVREKLSFNMHDDFENFSEFKPRDFHAEQLGKVLDQTIAWADALAPLRK